jgi:hypothetical protein
MSTIGSSPYSTAIAEALINFPFTVQPLHHGLMLFVSRSTGFTAVAASEVVVLPGLVGDVTDGCGPGV